MKSKAAKTFSSVCHLQRTSCHSEVRKQAKQISTKSSNRNTQYCPRFTQNKHRKTAGLTRVRFWVSALFQKRFGSRNLRLDHNRIRLRRVLAKLLLNLFGLCAQRSTTRVVESNTRRNSHAKRQSRSQTQKHRNRCACNVVVRMQEMGRVQARACAPRTSRTDSNDANESSQNLRRLHCARLQAKSRLKIRHLRYSKPTLQSIGGSGGSGGGRWAAAAKG